MRFKIFIASQSSVEEWIIIHSSSKEQAWKDGEMHIKCTHEAGSISHVVRVEQVDG